jgi:EF-P beta-lysylation protein EpmB
LKNPALLTVVSERRQEREPFTGKDDLLRFLELDGSRAPYGLLDKASFPLLVPKSFAFRMRKRDWFDPLLLQVLPRIEENVEREGFVDDPVHDIDAAVTPGVLQKYHGRALILVSNICSLRCRYCFRRGKGLPACGAPEALEEAVALIKRNGSLHEVILSGGDPLCLAPDMLDRLARLLAAIPHVKTIRLHTRLPVADPGRVGPHLSTIAFLSGVKNCVVVIHANHAAELEGDCPAALSGLRSAGSLLLNQSVLLHDVNDRADRLAELSGALLDNGVLPYYLHQLDRVRGAWHFEIGVERGRKLMGELRRRLPGYALPRYVREIAGEQAKMPL